MKKLEKLTLKELKRSEQIIDCYESQKLKGGYSFEEYESMLQSGEWTGGYVDDMGYVGYTSEPMYGFAGSSTCMSFSDWSSGNVTGLADLIAAGILGEIPILGSAVTTGSTLINNIRWEINTALIDAGVTGNEPIYLESTHNGYNIYDSNGNLIYSK